MINSRQRELIFLSSLFFGVGLLPLFNDFPLFGDSHFFRNASYIAILPIFIFVIPFALYHNFKIHFVVKLYLFFAINAFILVVLLFILNYLLYDMYLGRKNMAFSVFIKTLFTLMVLVIISIAFVLFMYSCSRHMVIKTLIKGCTFATVFAVSFGVLELMAQFSMTSFVLPFYNLLDELLHDHENDYFGKFVVRSLAFEPSYLALPIAFLLPIALLGNNLYSGIKSKLVVCGLIFLSIISGSRTGIVVTVLQLIVSFVIGKNIFITENNKNSLRRFWLPFLIIIVFLVSYETIMSLTIINETSISNVERMGSWLASLLVFLDNPFIGVGLGLSGGFLADYYPDFFYLSYSANKWADYSDQFGSSVFAMLPRLIAELGIIGFTFIFFPILYLIYFIFRIRKMAIVNGKTINYHLSNCLLLIWMGLFIGSFGVDSIVFPGYWILLSISLWFIIVK